MTAPAAPVVVTGIGLVTPLGADRETTWKRLVAGETGIRRAGDGLAATVDGVSPNGARSRAGDFAVLAAREAIDQAGLDPADRPVGCAFGQSKPLFGESGGVDPVLLLASFTGWSLESVVRSHFRLTGPSANVAAACATGVSALETAAAWIRSGLCDAVVAGASESSLHPFYRSGFERLGVLAEGTDPSSARPFDRRRSGFAMGEGAAVLMLESGESCRRRGGTPLARLSAAVLRQSSVDPLRFDDQGRDVARLVAALMRGRPAPVYINAHGTGTLMNDRSEARGIRAALPDLSRTRVGSTKASTGHLLGAAGAVEAAFAALAVNRGVMPPSLHVDEPDPDCELPLLSSGAVRAEVSSAASLSYGFGGQMGGVVFERA